MGLDYVVADVFTDTPLTGNQLAVFTDASDVDAALFQPLAREIGFSETVFVLPGDRIRIFTPGRELPFAGHPVLGTAFVLRRERGDDEITLTTGAGPVRVAFDRRGRGTMSQPRPTVEQWEGDKGRLCTALGVDGSQLPLEIYDNGPRHLYVVLAEPADVAGLRPDLGAVLELLPDAAAVCVAGRGVEWACRNFAPNVGVPEDPATGSAAGPLAVHLARHGFVPWGTEITITQGVEMQRPSTLFAVARIADDGSVGAVEVAGDTVVVGRGTFEL